MKLAHALANITFADAWFKEQGWQAFPFQRELWDAVAKGESGLLHATTGAGKTYAVWLAALNRFAVLPDQTATLTTSPAARKRRIAAPLTVLWITPMRALAADTERSLQLPLEALRLSAVSLSRDFYWTLASRTGDTSAAQRAQQSRRLPSTLITTPESLSLLLSRSDAQEIFATLKMVVVDEWHELIGNKRGVQLQLALARLRHWQPALITWGLSATLGNLPHACEVLLPQQKGKIVQGKLVKDLIVDTLLPARIERFPWAGHLGLRMLPQLLAEIEPCASSLIFTNTRAQAELWYQAILEARPDWSGLIALHHGSLDRAVREWVELAIKNARLKAVVCTSTLDLGVDFLPVERVFQIGSPKGIARLMQRAGRSGHAPGRPSRVTLVPTHSLELIESAAAQDAIAAKQIEPRISPNKPLDVLVQHLVTVALGGGFFAPQMFDEVTSSFAYRDLSPDEWRWALAFVENGGNSLTNYPDYRRAVPDEHGRYHVPDAHLATRHRMSIGTIVSDASIAIKFWSKGGGGKSLGSVEESFIARMNPGDHLFFAGRLLELVRVHQTTAFVRPATGKKATVPRWNGGRMPLSSELANAFVGRVDAAAQGIFEGPEMQLLQPLCALQTQWSALPTRESVLAESMQSREGWHLFLYPFAGRNVHLGLASLLAWRLGQTQPNTFSIAVNDYGLELLSGAAIDWAKHLKQCLFHEHNLLFEVLQSLNASELAQRRFREIARISGLVFSGGPHAAKSTRQLQASAKLFYDVFRSYDPENLLLKQAEIETLSAELDLTRLRECLAQIRAKKLNLCAISRPTPFAFPLLVERLRESVSSEKLSHRIARMVADLEKTAESGGSGSKQAEDDISAAIRFTEMEVTSVKRARVVKDGRPMRSPSKRPGF